MSKRKGVKNASARRGRPQPRPSERPFCPESLHPVVAIIDERVEALERLLETPGITLPASRELKSIIKVLTDCKRRVMLDCSKGDPSYHAPSRF